MDRKIVSGLVLTILLIGMLALTFNIQPIESNPGTICVPDDYDTIQEAINAAGEGDTIQVEADTYYEAITIYNKSLNLIGDGMENTIIDGTGSGEQYVVNASYVSNTTISGFTIREAYYPDVYGIEIRYSDNVTITKNNVTNNDRGILILGSSEVNVSENIIDKSIYGIVTEDPCDHCNISKNNITCFKHRKGKAIDLHYTNDSLISGNTITGYYGIMIDGGNRSGFNYIGDNVISNTTGFGISCKDSPNNEFENNTVQHIPTSNEGHGLLMRDSSSSTIVSNFFYDVWKGGDIGSTNLTVIKENTFLSCTIGLEACDHNFIYHNNFLNNSVQADPGTTFWDNGSKVGGNYWSDYDGEDTDNDGFGDTETQHLGCDRYPLVVPKVPIPILHRGTWYDCAILGNLTVSRFRFDEKTVSIDFNVTGHGYCNLTVPRELLEGTFCISVDNTLWPCITTWNGNGTVISVYFKYETSVPHEVEINATGLRFPSWDEIRNNQEILEEIKKFPDIAGGDDKINIKDIAMVARCFGKSARECEELDVAMVAKGFGKKCEEP